MLGNTTNNFNNLMGMLCRCNHNSSGRSGGSGTQQANAQVANNTASNFSGSIGSADSNLASSFGGFQKDVGQRYSMSNEQTIQMLQMFLGVLEELMSTVANNTQRNAEGQESTQQNPSQPTSQQGSSQSAVQQNSAQLTSQQSAGGNNNPGSSAAGTVPPASHADSADSTQSVGNVAGSGESAPTHKSGGCPFMAQVDSQQDNNAQVPTGSANNNQNTQSTAGTTTGGAAGPDGQLPNAGVTGSNSTDKADNRDIDFSKLSKAERSEMGLDDRERAVMHLWGRQMISAGEQNGGIYTNVLGADGTGANWANKEEVALVKELRAKEQERFGTDTGWMLDEMYFDIMKEKAGVDMSARYANRPVNESKGAINITDHIGALEQQAGISSFDQGVLRLMGHDALMDGEFDGSVLAYTAGNDNALDSSKHSAGNAIDNMVQTLLAEDKSDDGRVNGSSIMNHTVKALDKLYA